MTAKRPTFSAADVAQRINNRMEMDVLDGAHRLKADLCAELGDTPENRAHLMVCGLENHHGVTLLDDCIDHVTDCRGFTADEISDWFYAAAGRLDLDDRLNTTNS